MWRSASLWLAILLFISGMQIGRTQTTGDVIARGRQSTAFVDDVDDSSNEKLIIHRSGTAFCVSADGYFVTNYHVVKDAADHHWLVEVITSPGVKGQQFALGRIVRVDKALDLALIKLDNISGLKPLPLGNLSGITPDMPIRVFGFPKGFKKAKEGHEYPEVTVSSGHLVGLRRIRDRAGQIELNAALTYGSSGSPILNSRGEVLGVVYAGVPGTNHNIAIPINQLAEFLSRPLLEFSATDIPFDKVYRANDFRIRLLSPVGAPAAATVSLTLCAPGGAPRQYEAKLQESNTYIAHVMPLPEDTPRILRVGVTDNGQTREYRVKDRSLQVGMQAVKLSEILRIVQGEKPVLLLTNGKCLSEPVAGLEALDTIPGAVTQHLDCSKAARVTVIGGAPPVSEISYRVRVTRNGHPMDEQAGKIALQEAPAAPAKKGMLLACANAWPTNPTGSAGAHAADLTQSAKQYILNVIHLFTGGASGKFLIYSDHWAFGQPFQEVLKEARNEVTVSMTPGPLEQYDGVFVGGAQVDTARLALYVAHGGKVYLAGGCDESPDRWTDLLRSFGMQAGAAAAGDPQGIQYFGTLPLFRNVTELKVSAGMPIEKLPGDWPESRILLRRFNANLWAVYSEDQELLSRLPTAPVGEPPPVVIPPRPMPVNRVLTAGKNGEYKGDPDTKHWYLAVATAPPISWEQAKAAAAKLEFQGLKGHLVAMESGQERAFVRQNFSDAIAGHYWIGCSRTAPPPNVHLAANRGWMWVTGQVWFVASVRAIPNLTETGYLYWSPPGRWEVTTDPTGVTAGVQGYLVEFE